MTVPNTKRRGFCPTPSRRAVVSVNVFFFFFFFCGGAKTLLTNDIFIRSRLRATLRKRRHVRKTEQVRLSEGFRRTVVRKLQSAVVLSRFPQHSDEFEKKMQLRVRTQRP